MTNFKSLAKYFGLSVYASGVRSRPAFASAGVVTAAAQRQQKHHYRQQQQQQPAAAAPAPAAAERQQQSGSNGNSSSSTGKGSIRRSSLTAVAPVAAEAAEAAAVVCVWGVPASHQKLQLSTLRCSRIANLGDSTRSSTHKKTISQPPGQRKQKRSRRYHFPS